MLPFPKNSTEVYLMSPDGVDGAFYEMHCAETCSA